MYKMFSSLSLELLQVSNWLLEEKLWVSIRNAINIKPVFCTENLHFVQIVQAIDFPLVSPYYYKFNLENCLSNKFKLSCNYLNG